MPVTKLQFKAGINKENTNYAGEGGWYSSEKIRFRSGSPEKIGGWVNYSLNYTFNGCVHSLWNWVSYTSENLCAMGSNQRYYVELGGQYHSITPVAKADYLGVSTPDTLPNNPFTTTNGSLLIMVSAPGHGSAVNTFVNFSGASTVGGLTLNGDYEIVTIVDGNSYNIISPTAANSTGSGGGPVVIATYDIPAGSAVVTSVNGWGSGTWGSGVWGSSIGTSFLTVRLWSQHNYLQDLLFNPSGGPIYYWTKDTSSWTLGIELSAKANGITKTTTNAVSAGASFNITVDDSSFIDYGAYVTGTNVPAATYVVGISGTTVTLSNVTLGAASGAYVFSYAGFAVPNATNYIIASDTQRFTVALGANPYDPTNFSTTFDPMLVRWSDQDNPYDWTPTDFNQSGEQHITNGSYLIAAQNTRQEILLWSDSALYSMQYVGPPYVWNINLIADNVSILSSNAAVMANNLTFWMGMDKFFVYSGRVDTLPCTLKRYVYNNINKSQLNQVVCGTNEGFDEVWWLYPSLNSLVNDSYVIYNHVDQIWYYGTINRSAWMDSSLRPYPMGVLSLMNSYLAVAIGSTDTSIALLNATSYPASGTVQIDSEFITYDGISGNTLLNCTRGATFSGVTSTAASHLIYAASPYAIANQIIYHENGNDDGTTSVPTPIASYLESSDYDIDDGDHLAYVWRVIPDFTFDGSTSSSPQLVLTIRPRLNSGSAYVNPVDQPAVTQTTTIPVEQYTGEVYTRIRGRQMSLRIDSTALGVQWQMGTTRIDIKPDGRR